MMKGAWISAFSGKHRHVGNSGSSHCEYMALERNTRTTVWLRELFLAMQIIRISGMSQGTMNFTKMTRLFNETSRYRDRSTKCDLLWVVDHEGVRYGAEEGGILMGKWAVITKNGSADILAIATELSPPMQHGPDDHTTWTTVQSDRTMVVDSRIKSMDMFDFAPMMATPTVVIGDNITALKWAFVDAVTPNNKHIRSAYHWLREHIREGSIDLRDCPTQDNLADFLTKPLHEPPP